MKESSKAKIKSRPASTLDSKAQNMDVDEIDSSTGLPEEEKYFTAIGFGSSIFRTTLGRLVEDSQETFKKELTK